MTARGSDRAGTDRLDVTLSRAQGPKGSEIVCTIETLDPSFHHLDATVSLIAEVVVHNSQPINKDRVLDKAEVRLSERPVEVRFPVAELGAYSYRGRLVDVRISTKVVVDDALIFDTKIVEGHDLDMGGSGGYSKSASEPDDPFDLDKNLEALSGPMRTLALVLRNGGWALAAAILVITFHDSAVGAADDWYFPFDGGVPTALVGIALAVAVVWLSRIGLRVALRQYMTVELRDVDSIRRGRTYAVGDLITGRARRALRDLELLIVVGNTEHGAYRRHDGTRVRTVRFGEPTRMVEVFRQTAEVVPRHQPIERCFDQPVDFEPAFVGLYPAFKLGRSHGVGLYWKAYLRHPEFRDHTIEGDGDVFTFDDFVDFEGDGPAEPVADRPAP